MPCDAIAVAKGQVPLDLARELDGLGSEAAAQALLALLRQRFAPGLCRVAIHSTYQPHKEKAQ